MTTDEKIDFIYQKAKAEYSITTEDLAKMVNAIALLYSHLSRIVKTCPNGPECKSCILTNKILTEVICLIPKSLAENLNRNSEICDNVFNDSVM